MDEDDLPPPQTEPEEPSLANSLGQVFGSMIWILALFAVAALVVVAIRWLH
jgi:flagellar biogenesis protein FliO